jgi:molecular chaperone HtpG
MRLTDSPACLVADEHDVSGNLARILKAAGPEGAVVQAHPRNQPAPPGGAAPQVRGEEVRRLGAVLFDQALLAEGGRSTTRRPSSSA